MERYAIIGLAKKKFPSLAELDREEQLQIKINLAKELLAQDERELENLQHTIGKTSIGKINKVSDPRVSKQSRKVFAKKRLLNDLQSELRRNKSIY